MGSSSRFTVFGWVWRGGAVGGCGQGWVLDPMTPSVIPFWNRLTKCNNILKEKVKKIVICKIFFSDFTSASAKSNLANVGFFGSNKKKYYKDVSL